MERYRVICKACGHVEKEVDKPGQPIDPRCTKCGAEKMAVEPVMKEEIDKGATFDIVIFNKETNRSIKDGFAMSIDELNLTETKKKKLLVKKVADVIVSMMKKDQNVATLLQTQN